MQMNQLLRCFLLTIFFGWFALETEAQNKDFRSLIPQGYDTLYEGVAKGDLNKDGIEDVALALFHRSESIENSDADSIADIRERVLLVLFGSKKGYTIAARNDSLIMCKQCGGAFGDPFAGIEISKGVLIVYHYGGTSWKWAYTHRFRYQEGDFYLIGKTANSFWSVEECEALGDFAGTNLEDINYLTGQFEIKKISEDCKLLQHKKGKMKISPLKKLSKVSIE
jgi:hypothetical protein